jgi:beta-glucosidase
MKSKILLFGLLLSVSLRAQVIQKKDIPSIIKKLTLQQKIDLVVGTGVNFPGFSVSKVPEKVPGAAGHSFPIASLSIPTVVLSDGPAGVRIDPKRAATPDKTYYATAFPIASLLSSTWDKGVVQEVGKAFGEECRDFGVDILLAPAMNIHRNPLGGRNFEYYSEDPLLSGKTAAAFVNGVQSQGVGTSIKHFVANNQETNRMMSNSIISERALREIYLKGFEIAVKESDPWTVMSSYNKVNGVYTSQSADLITTILRDEWKFKGFVMTDWFAGDDPVAQLKAGNDLLMPGIKQQEEAIIKAVKDGSLSEEVLNKNIERILNVYVNTLAFKGNKYSDKPDLAMHKVISEMAATQGMVMLKNNKNILPLPKQAKIALFGNAAYATITGGTGSGDVNKAYFVSIADGLKNAGYQMDAGMLTSGRQYIDDEIKKFPPKKMFFDPDPVIPELAWTDAEATALAKRNDVALYVLGRISGEGRDRVVENDFNLNADEIKNLQTLSAAFHKEGKSLVVLLNIGGVIETASWKDLADGILLAWQPGQEAGNAVADIVTGKVNPSGKLPVTFPVSYNDIPSSKNFPGFELPVEKPDTSMAAMFRGRPAEVVYEEDIYVGYRYFETFSKPVSFPFGFGLSYTSFTYSGLKTELLPDGGVNVKFTVQNTGKVDGREVVEVYASAPDGKLKKPAKELKAFAKSKVLKPGEKQDFEFVLTPYQLSSYDADAAAWITEKGIYKILVGASIDNLPLSGTITKPATAEVLKTHEVLTPQRKINTLQ